MRKQLVIAAMGMMLSVNAFAHDEGHGPKLADTGKYGGLVSAVVLKADAGKGTKAELVHKAELVRTEGMLRVYLYDKEMKPLDLKGFDQKASVSMAAKVKGKWKNTSFPVELKDNIFQGKMPNPEAKPYNLDVTWKKDGKELLSAFDNLD